MYAFAAMLVAASTMLSQVDADKSFKSYADIAVGGTWTTTVDGKQIESSYRRIPHSHFVQVTNKGGPLPFVAMVGIDPTAKELTWWFFNNDGGIGKDVMTQEADNVWLLEGAGTGPNGKVQYKGRLTAMDKNTVKEEVLEFSIGDKNVGPGTFIWKRQM